MGKILFGGYGAEADGGLRPTEEEEEEEGPRQGCRGLLGTRV